MKKGRILKNIQFDERFASPYIFSFGFSKEEKLLLTQHSLGKDFGIISQVYDYHNSGCIEYFILRSYPSKKYNSKLVSIGILFKSMIYYKHMYAYQIINIIGVQLPIM